MQKITLKIGEVVVAKQAIDMLLRVPGIPYKKVYWLDKTRKHLIFIEKKWQIKAKSIFDKHCEDIPQTPFIPPDKYAEFKKEIVGLACNPMELEGEQTIPVIDKILVTAVLAKYEIIPDGKTQQGILANNNEAYQKEINEVAETFENEIEFSEIELDSDMANALQKIPGELQLALAFMFKDESMVKIFPGPKLVS